MRALITGSYGFLGYSCAMDLLNKDWDVVGIDRVNNAISDKGDRIKRLSEMKRFKHVECDISDMDTLRSVTATHHFDTVIHFAGQYSKPHATEMVPRYCKSNLEGFMNVIECARISGVGRFIYASSTFVEDHVRPNTIYGLTKQFNEDAAYMYGAQFGMQTLGIRYGSTFGPWCRTDIGPYKTARRVLTGERFPLKGGYFYKTAFLWSEDAIKMTVDIINKPLPSFYDNIVTFVMDDVRYDLFEMMQMMETQLGKRAKYKGTYINAGPGGIPEPQLAQVEKILGYRPPTNMRTAVAKFCEWIEPRWKAGKI